MSDARATPGSIPADAPIGVLGAGAMGAGIAQVAAAAGHPVLLTDAHPDALWDARARVDVALRREVDRGRLDAAQARAILDRMRWDAPHGDRYPMFARCALVIEAIVESLPTKQEAFRRLEREVAPTCLLASNTSSLSVTAIGAACERPARALGLHFFNPAPVLPLVEVVPGLATDAAAVGHARALMQRWGKTPVVASDTPGFIVNRIARPFYGEALRIFEEGVADKASIDWAMREIGGFRMGPFELMDLIGNDVNYAVSRSVFEAMGCDPRYRPSLTQQRMVEAGMLGRKNGRGHYDYGDGAVRPEPTRAADVGGVVVDRILTMLINEAVDALFWKVASRDDIDLAVTRGVSYPRGLLRWADDLGAAVVLDRLEQLQQEYGEDRYRPSPLLRRMARDDQRFYP